MKDFYDNMNIIFFTIFGLKFLTFIFHRQMKKNGPHHIQKIKCPKEYKKEKWDYLLAIISFIHSSYGFIFGTLVLNNVGFECGYNITNKEIEIKFISVCLGYFIFDTIMGFFTGNNDNIMLIHHFQTLSSLLYVVCKGKYINSVVWAVAYTEVSGILLQMRIIVSKHDIKKIYIILIGVAFSFLFFYMRIFVIGYRLRIMLDSDSSLFIKFFGAQIWYLSLFWCYYIFNQLIKQVNEIVNNIVLTKIYEVLKVLRKSKVFNIFLHSSLCYICFSRIFINWNHKEIF